MNAYEERQEARRARLLERSERAAAESRHRHHEATKEGALPPGGEPIKIGHHSEKKHRAAIARSDMNMRKSCEAAAKSEHYARAAESVGSGGISSDDPDAIQKLRAELESLEKGQALMKAANAAIRKGCGPEALVALGFSEAKAHELLNPRFAYYGKGFARFSMSNASANMRRIAGRIADLEKRAARAPVEVEHASGVRMVENVEANRVQLFFDGKPADDVRAKLKGHGFRWSPREGAWQRHLNSAGRYAAKCVLESL